MADGVKLSGSGLLAVRAGGSFGTRRTLVRVAGTFVERPLMVRVAGTFRTVT